jgi:hypothetical protein
MNMKLFFIGFVFFWSLISCADKVLESPTMPSEQTKTPSLKSASLNHYVAKTGSDSNPGTLVSPFLTIQKAANVAVAGDSVIVRAGNYHEAITISNSGTSLSPITFKKYQSEAAVIDGGNTLPSGHYGYLITISGNYINFIGFEVKNSYGLGIWVTGTNCTLDRLNVHDIYEGGIHISGNYGVIQNCTAYNTNMLNVNGGGGSWANGMSTGILKGYGNHYIMRNNICHDNWGEGISTYGCDNSVVEDNISYDNWANNYYVCNVTNGLIQRNFAYMTKVAGGSGFNMSDEWNTSPFSTNVTFAYNIAYGCKRNFYYMGSADGYTGAPFSNGLDHVYIYNNTFVNSMTNNSNANVVILGNANNVGNSFKNNIVSQDGSIVPVSISNYTGFTFSNNCWSKTPSAGAAGTGDVLGDPKFTNINSPSVANSYAPTSTSPVINKGVSVGMTTDYFKNALVGLPDLGAIEYIQGGVTTPPPTTVYYNVSTSGTAAKNDCGTGYTGSAITYTVAASKYTSTLSQADADSKALADVTANKQTYANTNGTCTAVIQTVYYNTQLSATATKNDCGTGYIGSTVTYTVAAKKYSSTISQADADSKAAADLSANTQSYANSNGTCTATAPTVYYNVQESGTATKNDCGTGYSGSTVTYTVSANTYNSTISQTDANNKAINDVNNNVQAYANANGTCIAITTTTTTTKTKKWWRR